MTTPFPRPPDVLPASQQPFWAILDLALEFRFDYGLISCLTDSPAHLYLNGTLEAPSFTPQHRTRRGILYETIPLWRNSGGVWVEQHETGDSVTHTFTLGGWPEGISVWYYFDGYKEGHLTMSSSVLFGSVRPPLNFTPALNLSAAASLWNPLFKSPGTAPPVVATLERA